MQTRSETRATRTFLHPGVRSLFLPTVIRMASQCFQGSIARYRLPRASPRRIAFRSSLLIRRATRDAFSIIGFYLFAIAIRSRYICRLGATSLPLFHITVVSRGQGIPRPDLGGGDLAPQATGISLRIARNLPLSLGDAIFGGEERFSFNQTDDRER